MGTVVLSIPIAAICYLAVKLIGRQNNIILKTAYLVLFLYALYLFAENMLYPEISYDTWQVYDMSRYVFSDFGYMSQIRQHIQNTHYEMAFPPIFPVLMYLVNRIYDFGVLSSVYINGIATLLIVLTFVKLGACHTSNKYIVLITAYFMIQSADYRSSFAGGLTQTIGFLLLLLLINTLLSESFEYKQALLYALLAGIGLMNRFDFLSIGCIAMLSVPVLAKIKGEKNIWQCFTITAAASVAYIAAISPWIVYSIIHFNTIFVTDNGRRLFNIPNTRPSTFFPAEMPAMTIRDDFIGWLGAFFARTHFSIMGLKSALFTDTALVQLTCFALVILIFVRIIRKEKIIPTLLRVARETLSALHISEVIVIFLIIAQELLVLATGYYEPRYHIPFVLLAQYLLLQIICYIWPLSDGWEETLQSHMFVFRAGKAFVVVSTVACLGIVLWLFQGRDDISAFKELSGTELEMAQWLKAQNCQCLVSSRSYSSFPRFSALSDLQATILAPSNLTPESVSYFVRDFDIDYVYASDSSTAAIFADEFSLENTPYPNLFYLDKTK